MTKIYLIRHCEADGNHRRVFQGHINTDITDLGAKQLEILSERFKDIYVDKVYSSPLLRAMKTAEAAVKGRGIKVIPFADLIELNGGVLEDKPFKETFLANPDLADTWDNHPEDFAPDEGEPMRDAYERIWNAILFIAKNNKDKSIALSTHGGVIRCLMCRLIYGDIKHLKDTSWSDNTAISLIEVDDNLKVTLKYYNDASHLPEELNPKRSRLGSVIVRDKQ